MHPNVTAHYRRMLREDFPFSGELEHADAFVEAIGSHIIHCSDMGSYMQLFLRLREGRVESMRYLCSCDPAANVAVEVLCELVRGKTVDEAACLPEESLYERIGSRDDEVREKVIGLLALLREALQSLPAEARPAECLPDPSNRP